MQHSIGSLSRREREPTGANVRPVLLSGWVLRGGPARTAAAAPGRAAHRRPCGRRGVRRRRAWGRSGLWRRSGLGLRLRLFGAALLRRDALFLTGRRGFFPHLPFLRPRLRLLRLLRFLRHDRLPIFTASLLSLHQRNGRCRCVRSPASRRALRVRGLRSPSRRARRCERPGSPCPQRSALCSRYCRRRSRRA